MITKERRIVGLADTALRRMMVRVRMGGLERVFGLGIFVIGCGKGRVVFIV